VRNFLIVYDLREGRTIRIDEYPDDERERAISTRFALENEYLSDPNLEVIMLSAESRASLEATHSRYFKRVDELAGEG
jgi:hypothetical protein